MASPRLREFGSCRAVGHHFDQRHARHADRPAARGHRADRQAPASSEACGTTSNPSSASPTASSQCSSSARATCRLGTPAQITSRSAIAGNQPQRRGGDDAQRAFRADQQLLQIEAAVVLLERGQRGIDAAVGQHRFQPQHQRPHRAVAQHLSAAGIGRDQPADRRRALAAQRQRKAQACGSRRLVQVLQDHPRLAGDLAAPRHRARGSRSSAAAKAAAPARCHPASRRPTCRCCRPAARSARHGGRRAAPARPVRRVLAGEAMARARPVKRPRQSVSQGAIRSASWVSPRGPSSAAASAMKVAAFRS